MFYASYLFYFVLVAAAVSRNRRRAINLRRTREWLLASAIMTFLPVVLAVLITIYFLRDRDANVSFLVLVFLVGVTLLLTGKYASAGHSSTAIAPALETVGWSLIAAGTLVPASTVLLAPIAGVLSLAVRTTSCTQAQRPARSEPVPNPPVK